MSHDIYKLLTVCAKQIGKSRNAAEKHLWIFLCEAAWNRIHLLQLLFYYAFGIILRSDALR